MFTGIIESTGLVKQVISNGSNKIFWVESSISSLLKADQSVSHSGTCLTVEEVSGNTHRITAIDETLQKTNLGSWKEGTLVNLERCLQLNDRLDGHLVQGHVDTTATCTKRKEKAGSWEFEFAFPKKFAELLIEKGSISVNGISLTAFDVKRKNFRVAIVPFTFEHTNIKELQEGDPVNLEFDMIGKYLLRRLSLSEGLPRRKSNN
ncbi:MAG TPA: riboflavin synthase [Chitinophagaceae bacterium]|nr:riboflavin synthase [Chitinophagaceae bacterium]